MKMMYTIHMHVTTKQTKLKKKSEVTMRRILTKAGMFCALVGCATATPPYAFRLYSSIDVVSKGGAETTIPKGLYTIVQDKDDWPVAIKDAGDCLAYYLSEDKNSYIICKEGNSRFEYSLLLGVHDFDNDSEYYEKELVVDFGYESSPIAHVSKDGTNSLLMGDAKTRTDAKMKEAHPLASNWWPTVWSVDPRTVGFFHAWLRGNLWETKSEQVIPPTLCPFATEQDARDAALQKI